MALLVQLLFIIYLLMHFGLYLEIIYWSVETPAWPAAMWTESRPTGSSRTSVSCGAMKTNIVFYIVVGL